MEGYGEEGALKLALDLRRDIWKARARISPTPPLRGPPSRSPIDPYPVPCSTVRAEQRFGALLRDCAANTGLSPEGAHMDDHCIAPRLIQKTPGYRSAMATVSA